MTVSVASHSSSLLAAGAEGPHADVLLCRLAELAESNEALGGDLLRCYEYLSFVFEITEHIAHLQDPLAIQEALLRRYAMMLNAGAVFIDYAGRCVEVGCEHTGGAPVDANPERLRAALGHEIDAVRRTHRARTVKLKRTAQREFGRPHVLLGALRCAHAQSDEPFGVVIALRAEQEQAFDSGDPLAAEAVLSYGGHILGNVLMVQHLTEAALETVCALTNAIEAKDRYTSGHSARVGWLAALTGREIGLSARQMQVLEWAGMLHDVGKIGVPEEVLNKPGTLTPAEREQIQQHPYLSYEVLKPVASLEPVLDAVLYHHENHDGSGYPEGLCGDQIPLGARIIRVADIFDAMTSTRSYRPGHTVEQALETLADEAARITDPYVTHAFITALRRYMKKHSEDFQARFHHATFAPVCPIDSATGNVAGEPNVATVLS